MVKQQITDKKTYLVVPFDRKDEALKAAGKLPSGENAITFDGDNKLWYAKPGTDLSKVRDWLPDRSKVNTTTAEKDPQIEFARTLEGAGFVLDGVPEMDGRRHRVKTEEDKQGQRSGVYVGYLDGVPAGWYQDHRNHKDPVKWKATGQKLDQEAHAHLRALSLQRKMEREEAQQQTYDHNARRSSQAYDRMPEADQNQGYLQKKGVQPFPGTRMDKRGRLVVPLKDENDQIRTLQRIDSTGFKSLKKNGQKTGNYFVVGDRELKNGEPILYAEGYSTAASTAEATARPVVMTVDAGNMPRVAEKLKDKYPDSPHVFLGDDDRDNKENKGREKAEEAARLTKGVFAVPEFNDKEMRAGLTDFNDLHQARGLDAVRDQVERIVTQTDRGQNMSKDQKDIPREPVVSEKFEQYVNDGMKPQPVQQQEAESVPANQEKVATASKKTEERTPGEAEAEGENTIEPHIEQKQETTADADARQWLKGKGRQSSAQILEGEEKKAASYQEAAEKQTQQAAAEAVANTPKPSPQRENPFSEQTEFKPVVPERVAKSYVEVEGKYYFANRPESLAFVDKGARLQTKLNNAQVAGSMVDIAEARGWTELQVKGTQDFRREAWLEAASRGLDVRGYKPQQEDLARLKKLTNQRQSNEIESRVEADQPRDQDSGAVRPKQEQGQSAKGKAEENAPSASKPEPAPEKEVNRLAGKVLDHGKAPYEHNPDNRQSYYVTLENEDGKKSTTWGVDLERAVSESGVKEGDRVELENRGRQPVTVDRPVKDENGKVVGTEQINTNRNKWEVKAAALKDRERDSKDLVREHPDLVNEVAAIKVAEKFSEKQFSNEADRDRFLSKVRTQLAGNVSKGQQAPEVKMREERIIEKEKDSER